MQNETRVKRHHNHTFADWSIARIGRHSNESCWGNTAKSIWKWIITLKLKTLKLNVGSQNPATTEKIPSHKYQHPKKSNTMQYFACSTLFVFKRPTLLSKSALTVRCFPLLLTMACVPDLLQCKTTIEEKTPLIFVTKRARNSACRGQTFQFQEEETGTSNCAFSRKGKKNSTKRG